MRNQLLQKFRAHYGTEPAAVAFAPGRIEVIGNHTDYNGGPVIGAAIDRGVWVAVAPRTDRRVRLRTTLADGRRDEVVQAAGRPERCPGEAAWANYPLGVIAAFSHFGLRPPGGFDLLAASDLPVGAGLSSSAAFELATALALLGLTGQGCPPGRLAEIGRHAENHFVGVPCGILDQGVSAHGRAGHVVLVDCAALRFEPLPLGQGLEFWVFNTHTKHALVDGLYAERHRECLAAAAALGVARLAEVSPEQLTRERQRLAPDLWARASHVVSEIGRVGEATGALRAGQAEKLGQLLAQSHDSSRHSFHNSTPELDFLVERLMQLPGVLGARLTGGGFGGAVLALTKAGFQADTTQALCADYAQRFGGRLEPMRLRAADGARLVPGMNRGAA